MSCNHLSFYPTFTSSFPTPSSNPKNVNFHTLRPLITICNSTDSTSSSHQNESKLEIGSPIIVVEAPQLLKTAASVPCLRANAGLVKPGDVGRIVARKPKDVWAIRLNIGTYLIDGKYFKPLEFDD